MIKTPLSIIRAAACCLPLALLASCGAEQGAAPGSTVKVTPEKVDWTVGPPVGCPGTDFHDTYFDISVKNPGGAPAAGVDVSVTLDLAPGTYVTTPVMLLFDSSDGSTYNIPITAYPYFTVTNGAGVKKLMVRYELIGGCTYAGNLNAYSGSSFGSANINLHE